MPNTNNHAAGNRPRQRRNTIVSTLESRADMRNDVHTLLLRELNPISSQSLPPVCDNFSNNGLVFEEQPNMGVPSEYFDFNSSETSTLISMILDSNVSRLNRTLDRVYIRSMLSDDRYYQIVDDPQLYCPSRCLDPPAFHNRVVLYLTASGLLVYLKQTEALTVLSRLRCKRVHSPSRQMVYRPSQSGSQSLPAMHSEPISPFFNIYAYQYATYVHYHQGDILRFQLDYLMFRRGYLDAVPILLRLGWLPGSPSILLYRCRGYQYTIPFLDWVDMMCGLLLDIPTVSVGGFYNRLLGECIDGVEINDLVYLGRCMLECIELRLLTKTNCQHERLCGLYAGRKIFRDGQPYECPTEFAKVFKQNKPCQSQKPVKPVLPHACSVLRRFLVHLAYDDRTTMRSLPQVMDLTDRLLQTEFFAPHPTLPSAKLWREPPLFQIYDFVWSIRGRAGRGCGDGGRPHYLRNESWEAIRSSEDAKAWYLRWDVFNCICLMFNILQNAILSNQDESIVHRLIRQLIDVLYSSKYLESFIAYSFFDVHLALTNAVNCVHNIQHSVFLRVIEAIPFHLATSLKPINIVNSFSNQFWSNASMDNQGHRCKPQTIEEITAFLTNRRRRRCVQKYPFYESRGPVAVFQRDYNQMELVTEVDEARMICNDPVYWSQRVYDERRHLTEYKQMEADCRLSLWQLIDQE